MLKLLIFVQKDFFKYLICFIFADNFLHHYFNNQYIIMDIPSAEILSEIQKKVILHWNYRYLTELPEILRKYGTHIKEIYLKQNQLSGLPSWIIELYNVTNLYLYGNFIKELPSELEQMNQLTVLDLSKNELSEIPVCIGNLYNLKSLLLNDNHLTSLPNKMINLKKLEILALAGNDLVILPEWIATLPKLQELNVDNNSLKELPNRLTLAPKITVISVCSNRLKHLPLNGFLSSPLIRYSANDNINYLSYPVLLQLNTHLSFTWASSINKFQFECKTNYKDKFSNMNIKLSLQDNNVLIELPRQLLKVYNIYQNTATSLYELAIRRIYVESFKHTLNLRTNWEVFVNYESMKLAEAFVFEIQNADNTSYNLIINGAISICTNIDCQQPIFTEAWVIIGQLYFTTTLSVALFCQRRCASEFMKRSNPMTVFDWNCVD
ncbi:leucine-rich repeat protein lrrA-like isoform X1 [Prorops nasuta]|uniref:leucine-rich repeat protein lrrA-like isoform X1 n=1 Tax=Prorops nasuta TaxID=863751 RepID=UPI0034CDD3D9